MELRYTFLLTIFGSLIVVGCASTDLEVNVTPKTGLDPKGPSPLNSNSSLNEKSGGLESTVDSDKVDRLKKNKDKVDGSKEGVRDTNSNERSSSEEEPVGSKDDHLEKRDKDGSVEMGDKKEKSSEGSESEEVIKEKPISLSPVKKEGSRVEECDTSNSCKDEKNALVACLRVPGNESPDLSLLIQNKGNGPLSVIIFAPDSVQLEKTEIQLQEKEDKKVKVSIKKEGTDSLIILTAGNGNCSIDFRDLSSLNFRKETDGRTYSREIKLIITLVIFVALVLAAATWMCVDFARRYGSDPRYRKLDMELPVSGGVKKETDLNDGWDNNWDDNWDDEEAPKTPSMPSTPSLSSKGLASRRFNKEGWKD